MNATCLFREFRFRKLSIPPLLRDFGEDEGVGEDAGGGRGAEDGDFEGRGVGGDGGREGGTAVRRTGGADGLFHGNNHSTAEERETRGARICDDSSTIQNEKGNFIGFFAHFLSNHHKFAERDPGN